MITKIAFVGHPTRNLAAAQKFYGETLGLASTVNYADHWAEYQAPDGTTIALDTFSPEKSENPTVYLALETDDIVAEVARLRGEGVQVVADVWENQDQDDQGVCTMAIVLDPDGNTLMLHEIAERRRSAS